MVVRFVPDWDNLTQAVAFHILLHFDISQSVLGLVVFLLYTADVAPIAQKHGRSVHFSPTGWPKMAVFWYTVTSSCMSTTPFPPIDNI